LVGLKIHQTVNMGYKKRDSKSFLRGENGEGFSFFTVTRKQRGKVQFSMSTAGSLAAFI
jgi:hypothetical protein